MKRWTSILHPVTCEKVATAKYEPDTKQTKNIFHRLRLSSNLDLISYNTIIFKAHLFAKKLNLFDLFDFATRSF